MKRKPQQPQPWEPYEVALAVLAAVALVVSPPLLGAGLALGLARSRWPRATAWQAIAAGLGLFAVFVAAGLFDATWAAGWRAAFEGGLVTHTHRALSAALPHWALGWLLTLPLAPALACVIEAVRPKRLGEAEQAHRERVKRHDRRGERRAGRQLDADVPRHARVDGERAVIVAARVGGEKALPSDGRWVAITLSQLMRHTLITGATGSGKTETALRLAHTLAGYRDVGIHYVDGKGDRETAGRFCALMQAAGRRPRVFPNEPFCGFQGDARAIQNRLVEVVDYASDGAAAWYRDVAKAVLALVCRHPDGPPRSAAEVLGRIDLRALRDAHGDAGSVGALDERDVRGVRLRYEAFFAQTAGGLDGDWAWEDTDCSYLLLDSLALKEETASLARYLFEDFAHYFTRRKPRERACVMIVDEFSALAKRAGMSPRLEQARGFNTGFVLLPQVAGGMGSEEEAKRILGSVETLVIHRVNTPDELVPLAGTRQALDYSQRYDARGTGEASGRATGEGSARLRDQLKVDPNLVRRLAPGAAFVVRHGQAMKVQIARAPDDRIELPEPAGEPPGLPVESVAPQAVEELPY